MADKVQKRRSKVVESYWSDHFISKKASLCSLCGNSGIIDTRGRARSAAGIEAGQKNYCICPNGQCMRISDPEGKRLEGD